MTISLPLTGGSVTAVSLLSLADIYGNVPANVAFPSAFTLTGGAWQFTFTGTSVTYNFTYSVTNATGTVTPFSGTVSGASGYQGRYINSTLLNQYLGSVNVAIQSDTNSTGMADASAIQQVIMAAEDECDSVVSGSPTGLQVPISFGTNPINAALQLRLCQYAGADLYDKRLLTGSTKKIQPPWGKYREEACEWFKQVWYGDRTLVNAVYTPSQSAPIGAIQRVNAAGMPILPNGASPWPWGWSWGWGVYGIGNAWWGWGYSWWL